MRKLEGVRKFQVPPKTLNLSASGYMSLIDFSKEDLTEPPLTTNLSDAQLQDFCKQESAFKCNIPCHSQNAERAVADVTDASKNCIGYEKRHQKILVSLKSRAILPTSASKIHSIF